MRNSSTKEDQRGFSRCITARFQFDGEYRRWAKYCFFLIICVSLAAGCSGPDGEDSPFSEILGNPPYASLTDSIRKEPKSDELYFRRAVLLNRNNLPEPALADFRKAWSLNREETYAIGIGNILLEKNADSAVTFLQQAARDLPESIFLRLRLARAYNARNETSKALAVCEEILHHDPNQINTLVLQSELLEQMKDSAGMIRSLEKAYRLLPGNMQLANKLVYQYAETQNPAAITMADSLIKADSAKEYADPYYVKGVYYANIHDRAKAIRSFDETIRHDHRYLNAYIEKARILLEQKQNDAAMNTLRLAIAVNPAFADAWFWTGRCQEAMGQKEEARLSYQKAYSLDKTYTEAKEAADRIR